MANRFVIFIKTDRSGFDNPSPERFRWDVRELLTEATGSVAERSGPSLVTGIATSLQAAKHEAETWAVQLAQETAYVFNTVTDPVTPLP